MLLVCLLYWDGDKAQMEKLAQLACDLLEEKTEEAEVMMVARYDSGPLSPPVQNLLVQKFLRMRYWLCDRRGAGFPNGCNMLAYGLLNHLSKRREEGDFQEIDSLLILESDCVITRRSWVKELAAEWLAVLDQRKLVAGALQRHGQWHDIEEHINAVALYDVDVACVLPCLRGGPSDKGWDHFHGPSIVPHALNSALFKLDYQKKTISPAELFSDPNVLIYHGVKDESAINAVRQRYSL